MRKIKLSTITVLFLIYMCLLLKSTGNGADPTDRNESASLFLGKQRIALFQVKHSKLTSECASHVRGVSIRTYEITVLVEDSLPESLAKKQFTLAVELPYGLETDDHILRSEWFPTRQESRFIAAFNEKEVTNVSQLVYVAGQTGNPGAEFMNDWLRKQSSTGNTPPPGGQGGVASEKEAAELVAAMWSNCKAFHRGVSGDPKTQAIHLADILRKEPTHIDQVFFQLLSACSEDFYANKEFAEAVAQYLESGLVPIATRTQVITHHLDVLETTPIEARKRLASAVVKTIFGANLVNDPDKDGIGYMLQRLANLVLKNANTALVLGKEVSEVDVAVISQQGRKALVALAKESVTLDAESKKRLIEWLGKQ